MALKCNIAERVLSWRSAVLYISVKAPLFFPEHPPPPHLFLLLQMVQVNSD